jgi:hypothetical protein
VADAAAGQFLEMGDGGMVLARTAVDSGKHRVAVGEVRIMAPLYDPEKIVCIGEPPSSPGRHLTRHHRRHELPRPLS